MSQILKLTAWELLTAYRNKELSPVEVTETYLNQMHATQHHNAYVLPTPERARQQAKDSQERWMKGNSLALDGLPLAIKDVFCTLGVRTTAGSKMLGNFIPPYESTVTHNVAQAGTVTLGKVNLDEFCMGSATTPSFTGATRNPWNTDHSCGGSSGGSAAALANGSALLALGTDTGGSVRQPAAFCGVVGVKPTYGRCSRWGVVAYASSLDTPGPMARNVRDAAMLFQVMAGYDAKDATSINQPVPDCMANIEGSLRGKKVGIPAQWYEQAKIDPEVKEVWDKAMRAMESAGCSLVPVNLPSMDYALPCYYVLACAEAASNLQRYDGVKYGFRAPNVTTLEDMYTQTRGQGFGDEVKRRIMIGCFVLSHGYYDAYYTKAQKVRQLIQSEFQRVFCDVDVMLTPTTPTPAFTIDRPSQDPVAMYWNDILTVPVNIGQVCAISVPAGMTAHGLPIGLQIIAPALHEPRLFQFGNFIEQNMPKCPLPF